MSTTAMIPTARLVQLLKMRDFIDEEIRAERALITSGSHGTIHQVADLYGVSPIEVLTGTGGQALKARQAVAWVLHKLGLSYPQIGSALGCHHTTAINSVRRVERDPSVRALLWPMLGNLEEAS